jgi:hypothetical protein
MRGTYAGSRCDTKNIYAIGIDTPLCAGHIDSHLAASTCPPLTNGGYVADNLKPVIVRTYSAGVHFGYLARRDGKEVDLVKSRRIWSWRGANTLSEIATAGLDTKRSRVAVPVSITLTEAIEIIDCTEAGVAAMEAAEWGR